MLKYNEFVQSLNENREGKPVDKKLWEKVLRLTRGDVSYIRHDGERIDGPRDGKGFKVYPSKYANQWATKTYNRLGGKWKSE